MRTAIRKQTMKSTEHNLPSPFPYQVIGGAILDERCTCGERRSDHEDTVSYGHGGTSDKKCLQFTWAEYIINREQV